MRRGRWSAVAALAAVMASLTLAPLALAAGNAVQMVDNEPDLTNWHFDPADLTVPAGTAVVWHNRGKEEHSVTADDKSFDSGLKKPGTDFQWTFPKVGVYAYHCSPHPWMVGKIRVVAGAAPTPVSSAAPGATAAIATPAPPASPLPAAGSGASPTPGAPGAPGGSGGTQGPAAGNASTTSTTKSAGGSEAAPTGSHHRSGGHFAGTLALVLGPTLAGLALGAKLRQSH
ncbi:MAG TPA: plastocyanin/azurin family copper-binding protein [Acidimicrobiia bacterium]